MWQNSHHLSTFSNDKKKKQKLTNCWRHSWARHFDANYLSGNCVRQMQMRREDFVNVDLGCCEVNGGVPMNCQGAATLELIMDVTAINPELKGMVFDPSFWMCSEKKMKELWLLLSNNYYWILFLSPKNQFIESKKIQPKKVPGLQPKYLSQYHPTFLSLGIFQGGCLDIT